MTKTCRWIIENLSYCGSPAAKRENFCPYHVNRDEAQMIAEEKYGEKAIETMSKKEYETLIDDIQSDMLAEDG